MEEKGSGQRGLRRDPTPTGPVPFWRLLLRGWGWLIVIAAPVVLILGGMVLYNGYIAARLALDGVETTATITSRMRHDADGDSRTDEREVHRLGFVFDAGGVEVTDEVTVSEAFWNTAPRGRKLPLRYVRAAPHLNEIEPGAHITEVTWGAIGLGLVLLVVGPVWRRRWRTASNMVWVRDHGQTRTATVTQHENTRMQVNDKSTYRLHWCDETGATGRTALVRRPALTQFPVGSEIKVYVDPVGSRPPVWQAEVGIPARTT